MKARSESNPDIETYYELIENLERQRRDLQEEIQRSDHSTPATSKEVKSIYQTFLTAKGNKDENEVRRQIRMRLRTFVQRIYVLPFKVNRRTCRPHSS